MGICTRRHFLLSVCILQLISTVIRQVFDFLGYMWIPILVNFFEIIFIIFGFFGAFQYQPKYVISYSVWNLVLLAWNLFLVCLYLDIGILSHQESKVLKLDPESASWWQNNGPGCKVTYNTTGIPKPDNVTDCLIDYIHVEVFQAGLQCLLALLGCVTGICLGSTYLEKDDSFEFLDGDCRTPEHLVMQPMYVSETNLSPTSHIPSRYNRTAAINSPLGARASDSVHLCATPDYTDDDDQHNPAKLYYHFNVNPLGHAPMSRHLHRPQSKTKVALHVDRIRTSYQEPTVPRSLSYDRLNQHRTETFDNNRPKSLYSATHSVGRKSNKRTSLYSIEFSPQHDTRQADSDSMEYGNELPQPVSPKPMTPRRVKRRSVMTRGSTSRHSTSSRRYSTARSSTRSSRRMAQNPVTQIIEQQQKAPAPNPGFECSTPSVDQLPVYYNQVVANQQQNQWQVNGHTNPTYQQSSNQSLNEQDDLDELYNNRPASVRSSYSNFHGTRAISYGTPQYYHSHATPQVPQKRGTANRQSLRSTAFLKNGPPAYSIQGHTSVDSETTI